MKDHIKGIEHWQNISLAPKDCWMSLLYATHILQGGKIEKDKGPRYFYFKMRAIPMIHRKVYFLIYPFKWFEYIKAHCRLGKTK